MARREQAAFSVACPGVRITGLLPALPLCLPGNQEGAPALGGVAQPAQDSRPRPSFLLILREDTGEHRDREEINCLVPSCKCRIFICPTSFSLVPFSGLQEGLVFTYLLQETRW